VAARSWFLIALLALLSGLAIAYAAYGAGGELDPSFDGDGKVLTDFGALDRAFEVAIQADGKIVAAGHSGFGDFALARYNPDGSLDSTFDGDGRVLTDFGGDDRASGVAIQTDGKIVAAGHSSYGPIDFALARYNVDGSLDSSFDGDGRVLTDFGAFEGPDEAGDVAIQADGKIVAAGQTVAGANAPNFGLARYNVDGSLDRSFDGDGRAVTDFGPADYGFASDSASGVTFQADGKIVAVGSSLAGVNPWNVALVRYNPDGSLDSSFDGDGRVVTDFGQEERAGDVAIQADGRIVAAGLTRAEPAPRDFALARYDQDGGLDPTFDDDGKVLTDFGRIDEAFDVAIQADGRIVAAGNSTASLNPTDFALARYNDDGNLDSSFDGDGRVLTDFGASEFVRGLAIQGDGRIVAAGFTFAGDFALARYDGTPVNQPPDCSTVAARPNALRPPNHKLRLVTLTGATDPDGDAVTVTITAVTQDEPVNGLDDGDRSPDARAAAESHKVLLRAERSGAGDGRVYRVSFTASDGKGGNCSGTVTVGVSRRPGKAAIDSAPPSFDSFGP
jgi:uncharacterized delta-60 repeat protein